MSDSTVNMIVTISVICVIGIIFAVAFMKTQYTPRNKLYIGLAADVVLSILSVYLLTAAFVRFLPSDVNEPEHRLNAAIEINAVVFAIFVMVIIGMSLSTVGDLHVRAAIGYLKEAHDAEKIHERDDEEMDPMLTRHKNDGSKFNLSKDVLSRMNL